MKTISLPILIALSSISITIAAPEAAQEDAAKKGFQIAKAADQRDSGWGDMTADMEMTLENRAGKKSTRKISTKQLEIDGDGDKSLSLFKEPRDVSGTAMLTFSHGLDPDDQWLYLPALKRVKRISSKNKSGPFMGSEFAFEDLGSQEVEKYSYKYLRDEACGDGWQCSVSERYPEYDNSGYSKMVAWIDKAEYRNVKVEYYDRKDALLKTLTFSDYQQHDNYWRANQFVMQNHLTGKKTTLDWSNYQFGTGLSDKDFNKNALSRLR